MQARAIWLVAGGPMQAEAAAIAKGLGYRLIVSDGDKECALSRTADVFLNISTFDVGEHLELSKHLQTEIQIGGVLTFAADCHYTVARLATSLGLPTVNPDLSWICWNKELSRAALREVGFAQPLFSEFKDFNSAAAFASELKGPFVLKPTNSSGSRGFRVVQDLAEFDKETFEYTKSFGLSGSVILEERLEAAPDRIAEISVETVWSGESLIFLNAVDRIFGRDIVRFPALRNFYSDPVSEAVEIGHISPSSLSPREIFEMMEELNSGVSKLVEQYRGDPFILKFDLIRTKEGWVILEMTPRLSGGWDSSLSSRVRGGRLIELSMRMAVSGEYSPDLRQLHEFHDSLISCVLSLPDSSLDNCIGRRFGSGSGQTVQSALSDAVKNLIDGNFIN